MKSFIFALSCSLVLAACAVAPVQPPVMDTRTVTVTQEVPVPCVTTPPASPAFQSDRDLLSGSGKQVADQLWIDHIEREDYEAQLVAVLAGCQKPQAQPASPK